MNNEIMLNENKSISKNAPEPGKTYKFAGYDWTVCELVNDGRTAVLQSHGVTHGAWPGYVMPKFGGNADTFYTADIAGEDISAYDDKMQALYDAIKDMEDKSAAYGRGLYLMSKEKVGFTKWGDHSSGYYWTALKKAAENARSFGDASVNPFGSARGGAWFSAVFGSYYAWFVYSVGDVFGNYNQDSGNCVVAPAFNLDLSKVEIAGDEIIKKAQPAYIDNLNKIKKEIVTSMKIMDVTIKGIKESDEYKMAQAYNQGLRDAMSIFERESDHIDQSENQPNSAPYRSIWEYGMNLTKDGETFHLDSETIRQIFEAIKEDNGRNYVATFTSRKFSREQYIDICDEVENLLANDSGDVEYQACEHVLGVGFDKE